MEKKGFHLVLFTDDRNEEKMLLDRQSYRKSVSSRKQDLLAVIWLASGH